LAALKRVGAVEWLFLAAAVATTLIAFLCFYLGAAANNAKIYYFVLFLLWSALLLAFGAIFIKWRIGLLDFSRSGINKKASDLAGEVFQFRGMLIGGVCWGLLFASFPFLFGSYGKTPALQLGLAIFLFSLNLITGATLVALIALLRRSWQLAELSTTITLFSRSTRLSTDYIALLRTVTMIAAAHILLVLVSVSFSPFPTPWLLIFSIFSISILLVIYFVPQIPLKRRLEAEKIELMERIGSAKTQILHSELTPPALEHLGKLNALEEKVGNASTSLSRRDDNWVKWSALLTGFLPYVGIMLTALGASSKDNAFVKTLSDMLPVLRVLFEIPD